MILRGLERSCKLFFGRVIIGVIIGVMMGVMIGVIMGVIGAIGGIVTFLK